MAFRRPKALRRSGGKLAASRRPAHGARRQPNAARSTAGDESEVVTCPVGKYQGRIAKKVEGIGAEWGVSILFLIRPCCAGTHAGKVLSKGRAKLALLLLHRYYQHEPYMR